MSLHGRTLKTPLTAHLIKGWSLARHRLPQASLENGLGLAEGGGGRRRRTSLVVVVVG
jgi:hypothetical protein